MSRPLGSKNRVAEVETGTALPWTGTCRSMECSSQGSFNNFRIVTLRVEAGKVVEITKSEPYASFEAIARMEIDVQKAALSLNFNYEDGKPWTQ